MTLTFRQRWMIGGFAAAALGDWLLAVRGSPPGSPGFLAGVGCFAAAHLLWMTGQVREAKPDARAFVATAIPLLLFSSVRLVLILPTATAAAIVAYAAVSALGFAMAVGTRRRLYMTGIALLLFSDTMIGGGMLHAPGCRSLVGPTYIAAEICLLVSCFRRQERRLTIPGDPLRRTLVLGGFAVAAFLAAMATFPGGYNPCMRMLSALGRTVVREVEWPWSHALFIAGMMAGAAGAATALLGRRDAVSGIRRRVLVWSAAVNAGGLLAIAAIPENVNMMFHNAGCWLAAIGGGMALLALDRRATSRAWTVALLSATGALCISVLLHALKVIPFAPAVPTTQKIVILAFVVWIMRLAWGARLRSRAASRVALFSLLAIFALAIVLRVAATPPPPLILPDMPESTAEAIPSAPLTEDEQAALRWLDHVTGPLSPDEEKDWWDIGGTQHGLFAKRYSIAFCGYAAAALGMRGGEEERATAGLILGRCIERYIRRDVWAYSMSKSYWGRKPWAPDPCYRENVMYTGHLLQLLALYETFTGDTRYWTEGWDFVWKDGRRIHYTVQKLIDVTVHQMRRGPNGGITCEPGLMFFPCNNHPHIALALFSALGHGDWTADARRWESWALEHYARPRFGGGALCLVYHARSNLLFPRGHNGLDGWSLLWYEPWADNRATALALWREAAEHIGWTALESPVDEPPEDFSCDNPAPVPPVAAATFLAAAARACDDTATAERLERLSDRTLVRRDGMLWLDVGRDWRIGSTANRILALAEQNGSRFRTLVRGALPRLGLVRADAS